MSNSVVSACANSINASPVNFDQYRDVTLLFIDDVIGVSTTHYGKLDEESLQIKSVLNQLNRLDCVTINSQPAEYDTFNDVFYRSRPYVYFYYPSRKINQLLDLFLYDNVTTLVTVYTPSDNRITMYNDELYTHLADKNGYLALHQDFIDGQWIENSNTSFNPNHMAGSFSELGLTNNTLLDYGKENLVLVNVIGMDFTNNTFTRLAHAAHALFFS